MNRLDVRPRTSFLLSRRAVFCNEKQMPSSIILYMDIKEYVALRKSALKNQISSLAKKPRLSIITVGNDPASEAYVRGKKKDAAEVGIEAIQTWFPGDISEETLLDAIRKQNNDSSIDGILVQLPVPKSISVEHINLTIDPKKDVDGFTPLSQFRPCTPRGIIDYLTAEKFPFKGANAVVVGRSEIVGKPMAKLLLEKDCNVVQLHSKTKPDDLHFYFAHADLIVSAIGKMNTWDTSYSYRPSAWLIDVGITRGEDGHLHGDFVPSLPVAKQTPVPGGVGLLTRLALLENLMEAVKHR